MSWERLERKADKGPIGFTQVVIILGLLTTIVVVIFGLIGKGLSVANQPLKVIEKTLDADNMIYNYEWFKKQVESVQSLDNKIRVAESAVATFNEAAGDRKDWTFEDKTEFSRLTSIVSGLQFQRSDAVALYNAKAKMANRNIFMGSDCPQQLQ